jgi:hypothetical protein
VSGLAAYFLSRRFRRQMNVVIGVFLGVTFALHLARIGATRTWSLWLLPVASLTLFAVAFLAWHLDRKRAIPLKRWGHGLWHILTAVASTLAVLRDSPDRLKWISCPCLHRRGRLSPVLLPPTIGLHGMRDGP